MIERKICRIIDGNPNLIKILDHMPKPYKRYIITKHWGIQFDDVVIIPNNWMDMEPNMFCTL